MTEQNALDGMPVSQPAIHMAPDVTFRPRRDFTLEVSGGSSPRFQTPDKQSSNTPPEMGGSALDPLAEQLKTGMDNELKTATLSALSAVDSEDEEPPKNPNVTKLPRKKPWPSKKGKCKYYEETRFIRAEDTTRKGQYRASDSHQLRARKGNRKKKAEFDKTKGFHGEGPPLNPKQPKLNSWPQKKPKVEFEPVQGARDSRTHRKFDGDHVRRAPRKKKAEFDQTKGFHGEGPCSRHKRTGWKPACRACLTIRQKREWAELNRQLDNTGQANEEKKWVSVPAPPRVDLANELRQQPSRQHRQADIVARALADLGAQQQGADDAKEEKAREELQQKEERPILMVEVHTHCNNTYVMPEQEAHKSYTEYKKGLNVVVQAVRDVLVSNKAWDHKVIEVARAAGKAKMNNLGMDRMVKFDTNTGCWMSVDTVDDLDGILRANVAKYQKLNVLSLEEINKNRLDDDEIYSVSIRSLLEKTPGSQRINRRRGELFPKEILVDMIVLVAMIINPLCFFAWWAWEVRSLVKRYRGLRRPDAAKDLYNPALFKFWWGGLMYTSMLICLFIPEIGVYLTMAISYYHYCYNKRQEEQGNLLYTLHAYPNTQPIIRATCAAEKSYKPIRVREDFEWLTHGEKKHSELKPAKAPYVIYPAVASFNAGCSENIVRGCESRIGKDSGVDYFKVESRWSKADVRGVFRNIRHRMCLKAGRKDSTRAPLVQPMTFDHWVAPFPPTKREMYRRMHDRGDPPKSTQTCKIFVKEEIGVNALGEALTSSFKDPRIIQMWPPETNLHIGPWMRPLAKLLRDSMLPSFLGGEKNGRFVYTCGMNVEEIGKAWDAMRAEVVRQMDVDDELIVIEDDQSRFDLHINFAIFEQIYHKHYRRTLPRRVANLLRRSPIMRGRSRNGHLFECKTSMQSGAPDTSYADTLVNMVMKTVIHGSGIWYSLVCGDDSLTVTTRRTLEKMGGLNVIQAKYAAFGMDVTMKQPPIETAEFCSSRFMHWHDQMVLMPKIGRLLSKIGFDHTFQCERQYESRQRAVASTLAAYGKYDPLCASLSAGIRGHFGDLGEPLELPEHKARPVSGGTPCAITEALNYHTIYGLPIECVLSACRRLEHFSRGEVIDDPVLALIVNQDT